jgi:monovalent cation/hydrogen antiporter
VAPVNARAYMSILAIVDLAMHQAEIIVLLFALVAVLVIIAHKLALPYPIVLVLAGLALSFIPRLPQVQLNPDTVFYFFLPPLIYPAALFTSWRDFRRNLRPIALLSIGLVLTTIVVVAWTAHTLVPAMPWAAAFALGAIVSPTDAIAATSVIRRLSLPNRIEVVLEGESLVNDATALVALQFAVGALITGSFSLGAAAGRFVVVVLGGVGFGLLVGLVMRRIHRMLDDPPVQITISLLTPFIAYLGAERMHTSGILAVVAAGIFLGWHSPVIVTARYRLQAFAFWEMVVFLLNGFVFIIIGLQLPAILRELRGESLVDLIDEALLVSAATVLIRIVWVFPVTYLPRFFVKRIRQRDPYPDWRNVMVVAWSGMRGVISLAAAFALPFALPGGAPFPARNYILFFTFCVIFATLVLQGLTLPLLIKWFRIESDPTADDEERKARLEANKAALELIEQAANKFPDNVVERLREEYRERLAELELCGDTPAERRGEIATRDYVRLQLKALKRERETIIRLRNQRVINDAALRHIQRDLDLAEAQLETA